MENQETPKSNGNKKKIIIAAIAVVVAACVLFVAARAISSKVLNRVPDTRKPNAIITVGDYGYEESDMMYYIYQEESIGCYFDQICQSFSGYSYWTTEDPENGNLTGIELAQKNIKNAVKKDLVWYQEALKAGYKLTDSDKSAAKDEYDSFCENLSDKQKNTKGMGQELLSYFEKQQVISHYKEDLLEEAEFDYDAIAAGVSKKEYRTYKYEYYCIYKSDDDGNVYNKKELKKYVDVLKEAASKIKKDNNMETLLTDEQKDLIEYGDDRIVENEEEGYGTYKDVDIDALIKKMKNGQVSDVVEMEDAYYVFRMDDNNSEEAYEEQLDTEVETAQSKIYNTAYKNAKGSYEMSVKQKAWDEMKIGSIIYEAEE